MTPEKHKSQAIILGSLVVLLIALIAATVFLIIKGHTSFAIAFFVLLVAVIASIKVSTI